MQFSLLSAKNSILAVLSWGDFLSLSFPSALLFPFFPNRKMAGCNFSLLAFSPSPPLFPYQTRQEEEGRGVSPRHEITIFLPHLSLVERTTGVFQKKKNVKNIPQLETRPDIFLASSAHIGHISNTTTCLMLRDNFTFLSLAHSDSQSGNTSLAFSSLTSRPKES